MKKTLLVLNGSHSDIPLIQEGKALGYRVITTGNNPKLIGHSYADEYINADYSDCKLIERISREKKIDSICACSNDFGAITAAYVAEKIGLPGHDSLDVTLTLHHKDKFKKLAKEHRLLTPEAESFDNEAQAIDYALSLDYPIIIKPIDLTGGKGITKATTEGEKRAAVKKALSWSPHKRIVIEQFINGTNHSFDTFIVGGKTTFCYSDNEYFADDPMYCKASAAPADNIEKVKPILIEECEKLASILNLVDGKLHMQYRMDEDGHPHVIEYTRRSCGDLYTRPMLRALGVNVANWIVRAECGLPCQDCPRDVPQTGFVGRACILAERNGQIKDVRFAPELQKHIFDEVALWTPGYEISNYKVDRLSVISYSFDSRGEQIDIINRLSELVSIEYFD